MIKLIRESVKEKLARQAFLAAQKRAGLARLEEFPEQNIANTVPPATRAANESYIFNMKNFRRMNPESSGNGAQDLAQFLKMLI